MSRRGRRDLRQREQLGTTLEFDGRGNLSATPLGGADPLTRKAVLGLANQTLGRFFGPVPGD